PRLGHGRRGVAERSHRAARIAAEEEDHEDRDAERPSVRRRFRNLRPTAGQASENVVPGSQLREAYAKIRELERALSRKTLEVEILRASQEIVKKAVVAQNIRAVTTCRLC